MFHNMCNHCSWTSETFSGKITTIKLETSASVGTNWIEGPYTGLYWWYNFESTTSYSFRGVTKTIVPSSEWNICVRSRVFKQRGIWSQIFISKITQIPLFITIICCSTFVNFVGGFHQRINFPPDYEKNISILYMYKEIYGKTSVTVWIFDN